MELVDILKIQDLFNLIYKHITTSTSRKYTENLIILYNCVLVLVEIGLQAIHEVQEI